MQEGGEQVCVRRNRCVSSLRQAFQVGAKEARNETVQETFS